MGFFDFLRPVNSVPSTVAVPIQQDYRMTYTFDFTATYQLLREAASTLSDGAIAAKYLENLNGMGITEPMYVGYTDYRDLLLFTEKYLDKTCRVRIFHQWTKDWEMRHGDDESPWKYFKDHGRKSEVVKLVSESPAAVAVVATDQSHDSVSPDVVASVSSTSDVLLSESFPSPESVAVGELSIVQEAKMILGGTVTILAGRQPNQSQPASDQQTFTPTDGLSMAAVLKANTLRNKSPHDYDKESRERMVEQANKELLSSIRPPRPPLPKVHIPSAITIDVHSPFPPPCRNGFGALSGEEEEELAPSRYVSFANDTVYHVQVSARREAMLSRWREVLRKQRRRSRARDREGMQASDTNILALTIPVSSRQYDGHFTASEPIPPVVDKDLRGGECLPQLQQPEACVPQSVSVGPISPVRKARRVKRPAKLSASMPMVTAAEDGDNDDDGEDDEDDDDEGCAVHPSAQLKIAQQSFPRSQSPQGERQQRPLPVHTPLYSTARCRTRRRTGAGAAARRKVSRSLLRWTESRASESVAGPVESVSRAMELTAAPLVSSGSATSRAGTSIKVSASTGLDNAGINSAKACVGTIGSADVGVNTNATAEIGANAKTSVDVSDRIESSVGVDALSDEHLLMLASDMNVLSLEVPASRLMQGHAIPSEPSLTAIGDDPSRRVSLAQPQPTSQLPQPLALRALAPAFIPQGVMIDYVPLGQECDPFRPQPPPPWVDVGGDRPTIFSSPVPFTSFGAIPVIRDWLEVLARRGNLNLTELRRQQARVGVDGLPAPDPRPMSDDIQAMFDPDYMLSGADLLPPGVSRLKVEGFVTRHRAHCWFCQQWPSGIRPGCYFTSMLEQLLCGISWPMSPGDLVPLYASSGHDGNHRSATVFGDFLASKYAKMAALGHIQRYEGDPTDLIVSPLGVAVQRAKQIQMEHATGIMIRDGPSYAAATAAFEALNPGFSPMKPRPIVDLTASGVNERCGLKRFRYAGLSAALELLSVGCFVAVIDLEAYYHQFPVSAECYPLLGFRLDGKLWYYKVLPMGLACAPYTISTWSAEFLAEQRALGVKSTCFLDDFFVMGDNLEECAQSLAVVEGGFESKGLPIAASKRQPPAQRVDYLGFSINTVTMTVSVIPAKAAGFLLVLESAIDTLRAGGDVSYSDWNHICCKLEDYAQVSQLGKSYVAWSWSYLKYGPTLSEYGRTNLLNDLDWWHEQLTSWASGVESGCEYPILNGAALAANPALINLVVTDTSLPDGNGAYHGPLLDKNPEFFSEKWPEGGRPTSSFVGELLALKSTLVRQVETLVLQGSIVPLLPPS